MRLIRPGSILVFLFAATVATTTDTARLFAQDHTLPRFDTRIVVTPARVESTVARVPAFVTLIDEEDIAESAARDIPDLLRQAGLQVTDVTGNGRSYRVDVRGFGATTSLNTLVLVDGRRINQPDLSDPDWLLIPLEQVARIEIIRGGGGAVSFGDNSSGGVINIITKNGGPDETRASVRTGSYSVFTPTLSTRGTRGTMSYAVSGGFDRSEGYRDNAQTRGGGLNGQIVLRPDGRFELGVSAGYHGDKTGLPGSLTETVLADGADRTDTVTPDDYADIDDTYVMLSPKLTLGGRGHATVDVSVRQRDAVSFSTFVGGDFVGETGIRTVTVSPKVVLAAGQGALTHQIVAGMDLSSAHDDITNTLNFGGFPDVGEFALEKSNRAAYLRDEIDAGGMTISGGYRYDAVTYGFEPSVPSERDFDSHAADIGVLARLNERASVFGSVSRSFRYPVLDELFDFFSNTIVTTLDPQTSVDVQGGVRVDAGNAQASLSVFRLSTERELFFNRASGFFGANENLDGTSHRTGVELELSTLVGRASVSGTLTMLDTSIAGGAYDGKDIPGAATRRGSIQLRLPVTDRVSLGVDGAYTGARPFEGDFANEFPEQDGYFLLDTKVTYQQGRARIFVELKNLLNQEYSEYGVIGGAPLQRAYYPSPGAHAVAGFDVTF